MSKLSKKAAKEIARNVVGDALAGVNYRICDSSEYTDENKELILHYLNNYTASLQKKLGFNPYTF